MSGVNTQLAEQSLIIKQGEISLIDASVIEAKKDKRMHYSPSLPSSFLV